MNCPKCGAGPLDRGTIWIHEYIHAMPLGDDGHILGKLPFSLMPAVAEMMQAYSASERDRLKAVMRELKTELLARLPKVHPQYDDLIRRADELSKP